MQMKIAINAYKLASFIQGARCEIKKKSSDHKSSEGVKNSEKLLKLSVIAKNLIY